MAAGEELLRAGVIMGSDSDLGVMRHACRALRDNGIMPNVDYEVRVVSAHRTPHEMAEYAAEAEERGLEFIIAGAGGSAHLPGMVSSETTIPVVGVAITSNPEVMNRALGSLIGMPEGKPLATFQAANGAYNAGRFAAQALTQVGYEASKIAIVMGSDSEHDTMSHVSRSLGILGLTEADYEEVVLDSDRRLDTYTAQLPERDFAAIIVSSSGNSNLPREMSIRVNVPILGVTITSNPDVMSDGLNELVNAPEGRAMAAFQGTAGAYNAGLQAARIVALHNPDLRQSIKHYDTGLSDSVGAKDRVLKRIADEAYYELGREQLKELLDLEMKWLDSPT